MTEDQAQILALNALGWIASQDEVLEQFLAAAGTDAATLRQTAQDPETQVAVMDFLLMQDDWVRDFCTDHALAPEAPMQARHALPGGAEMHWT